MIDYVPGGKRIVFLSNRQVPTVSVSILSLFLIEFVVEGIGIQQRDYRKAV